MSMPVLRPYGLDSEVGPTTGAISPFAPLTMSGEAEFVAAPPPGQVLHSPFGEAAAAVGGHDLEAEAADALLAELDDAEFAEALEALEDEAAARHLRSVGTWSSDSEAPVLATADTAQWLAELAEEADRVLGALEEHFGDRPVDSLRDGEIDAVAGGFTNPLTAQQQFLGGLLKKAKKLAKGVGKLAKKGVAFVGKLALGPLFGILRKLVQPLLKKVLNSAIGRLPASVRPLATQLAAKLQGTPAAAAPAEPQPPAETPDTGLAEEFDRDVTAFVAAPNEDAAMMSEDTTYESPELDDARARLVRELAEADPNVPPTNQLEQFIPVVMAAMPLIRMGLRVIGRDRVVNGIAGPLSQLISGMVGADAAKLLSRHIASTGLGLLGLEAGADGALGSEALVAATEDTVRHVMTLPPASMANELLLETEVQDAFAEAAARHLPPAVLRPELAERELDAESGVWVMMPRATRPCFRYKKYSRVIPVRITRPMARAVVLSGGDTLERRLMEEGVQSWPVDGEVELYELLPGGMPGHMSAFEEADDAQEFEELTQTAATMLAGNPRFAQVGRFGGIGRRRRPGTRYFRFRHRGRALRRRRRHGFALVFDLTAAQPVLKVNLLVGERDSHELAAQLQRRQLVQVVSTVRRLLDPGAVQAMTNRLERMLAKHGITAPAGTGKQLAEKLADAMLRTVSEQLPATAQTLAQAAQDPASGTTLTFAFSFADRAALAAGTPAGDPSVTIRPGAHRD